MCTTTPPVWRRTAAGWHSPRAPLVDHGRGRGRREAPLRQSEGWLLITGAVRLAAGARALRRGKRPPALVVALSGRMPVSRGIKAARPCCDVHAPGSQRTPDEETTMSDFGQLNDAVTSADEIQDGCRPSGPRHRADGTSREGGSVFGRAGQRRGRHGAASGLRLLLDAARERRQRSVPGLRGVAAVGRPAQRVPMIETSAAPSTTTRSALRLLRRSSAGSLSWASMWRDRP